MSTALDDIRIVLVEPTGPLNVGSTARAMKNFGLSRLVIVGDKVDPTEEQARLMAVRSHEILENAAVFPDVRAALADVTYVVGTTARSRHRLPTETARDAAPKILESTSRGPVAILFGREDHGLTKDELALCHNVVSVPTSPNRMSLNLGQAVMLLSYELFQASDARDFEAGTDEGTVLVGLQWQRLYDEVLQSCVETGYLHEGNRPAIEQSLNRLLRLGPIQTRDARHLFGLVRRMRKILEGEVRPEDGKS